MKPPLEPLPVLDLKLRSLELQPPPSPGHLLEMRILKPQAPSPLWFPVALQVALKGWLTAWDVSQTGLQGQLK